MMRNKATKIFNLVGNTAQSTQHTHTHRHTHTHLSGLTHTPILSSSAVSCRLKAGEWHEILQFESNGGLLTLSHPLFQENTGSTHLYIFISRVFTCNKNYISKDTENLNQNLMSEKKENTLGRFQFKASVKFNMF